jgi:hypothetical protein
LDFVICALLTSAAKAGLFGATTGTAKAVPVHGDGENVSVKHIAAVVKNLVLD